jgi:hypothetical protein
MAIIPVRRMYKSVAAGLPAKSESFTSIMVHALRFFLFLPYYDIPAQWAHMAHSVLGHPADATAVLCRRV